MAETDIAQATAPVADLPPNVTPTAGSLLGRMGRELLVPLLAIFTSLLIGAGIISLTTGSPGTAVQAYQGLLTGAVGSPAALANTLLRATPYILAGLAVALAFKCGLFNIGAEGQVALGGLFAAYVGYAVPLPGLLHPLAALAAGLLGGFLWGAVPGFLKARTGAHEVITTIMMNYLALQFVGLMLAGPLKKPGSLSARTPDLLPTARLPMLVPDLELHSGVILALLTAVLVWWFLFRTTWGFEIRTTGANAAAARYAGMPTVRNVILAMALSGALAGLAGAVEVVGVALNVSRLNPGGDRYFGLGFSSGYGFDSIAIALLGRSNPFGVVAAALLFGALRAGASTMQFNTHPEVPGEIISVIQGLILLFVAADAIIRRIYRVPASTTGTATLTTGWGDSL